LRPISDGVHLCDDLGATGQRCVHARIALLAAHWMPYQQKQGARQLRQSTFLYQAGENRLVAPRRATMSQKS
jgi:hypothetical protein